jgi:hypothetical protein
MVRRAHHHPILFLTLALGVFTAAGCGTAWKVIKDGGSPSPLKNAGPLTVSFDYSKLIVGGMSEAAFVQDKMTKEPDYQKTWGELKASFENHFVSGLAGGYTAGVAPGAPGPQGAHVVVFPTHLQMGKYMVVTSTATRVDAQCAFTVNGQPADEIGVSGAESATLVTPSVHQHIPGVASYMGKVTSKFLASKNK